MNGSNSTVGVGGGSEGLTPCEVVKVQLAITIAFMSGLIMVRVCVCACVVCVRACVCLWYVCTCVCVCVRVCVVCAGIVTCMYAGLLAYWCWYMHTVQHTIPLQLYSSLLRFSAASFSLAL